MNKAILMGRLTKDPEVKSTSNGISRCTFTVAVDRNYKNAQGERETDFIPCVAWRGTGEFVNRYFRKGQMIALVGSIQVRSWDEPSGQRRYMTEVIVDEVYFTGSKAETQASANNYNNNNNNNTNNDNFDSSEYTSSNEGFFEAPDDDTELPFDL